MEILIFSIEDKYDENFVIHIRALKQALNHGLVLTLFTMRGVVGGVGGKKAPSTSFSPVTSTNVGFGPQKFLTFSFNPYATLVQNFNFVLSATPKLFNLNQDHLSKKAIFQVLIKLSL